MNLKFTPHDDFGIIYLGEKRLDASVAIQFKENFRSMNAAGGDVILDMSEVEFLDSSGLGALVSVFKGMGDGQMMLCGLQPSVEKVMQLTRMNSVFGIHATVDDAIAAKGQTAAQ